MELIHIIGTTVPHFYGGCKPTAAFWRMVTDPYMDSSLRNSGMRSIQPTGVFSVTPGDRWACRSHSCPCSAFKSVPPQTKFTVRLAAAAVRHLPVSTAKTLVILAF